MINVCLSHDIDRIHKSYQYLTKPLRNLVKGQFSLFFKQLFSPLYVPSPYWGFDKIIEIENRYGVKSTHFILNESIKVNWLKPWTYQLALGRYKISNQRLQKMIRFLDQNGWEIGVHGSYNSYKDLNLLRKEKSSIERIVGHSVIGIRQHYLNLSDTTWEIQKEAGFKYDSTWGHTNGVGIKDGKIQPFFPIHGSEFCEIPMTIMDGPFASIQDKWTEFARIVNEIDKNNAYLVINYHNNNFNKLDFPSYEDDYIKMIEILREYNAQFMTMRQAYKTILSRAKDKR